MPHLKKKLNFSKQKFALRMKLLINFSTIIPRRTITIIWREKYGTLVIHAILLILTLFAVLSTQENRLPNLVKSISSATNLKKETLMIS